MENKIFKLIEKGESEKVEFKESLSVKDEIGESVSAFSNSDGGKILVGVSDKGEVKGVQIGKKSIEELANYIKQNTDNHVYPVIKVERIDGKDVILIKIKDYDEKPVFFRGKAYKRVGRSNHSLSASEIRKLAKEGSKRYWDEQICEGADLSDIDWDFVKKEFIPLYEKVSERKIEGEITELLESLKCIKNNKLTNAGVLLFGKEPQRFLMNAFTALARYKGDIEDAERLDYKEFSGNLFQQIENCNRYIREHMALMSRLKPGEIKREDIPEYGFFSIRELITNAVCHRDYSNQGSKVIVKMFIDRIDYYNPGGLVHDITPENIIQKQYSRNPTIAKVFSKVKYIEELGEGWNKIIKEHKEHVLKPKMPRIIADKSSMLVSLFSIKKKFEEKFKEKEEVLVLNERQKFILETIESKGFIQSREIQRKFNITRDTVNRDVNYLIKLQLIKKEGVGKSTIYIRI